MKITFYSWALALLVVAAPMTVAVAQMSAAPEAPAESQEIAGIAGIVVNVDEASSNLTIKKKDNTEESFKLDTATAITLDGKAAKLAELKIGHQVSLTMDGLKVLSIKAASKATT